jgi:sugar lactone lactonase YvrE
LPAIDVLDDELASLLDPDAALEELATGFLSAEGPIWVADGGYLLLSDVRNDARLRWDERSGIREVAHATHHGVGMTLAADGSLIVCEGATSMLVRMDASGTGAGREVLASRYGEPALNLHWGGAGWSTLFITGRTSLFRIATRTRGRREPSMGTG